jgi:tetratricopeptide (TPR) repeat protein
LAIAAWAAWRKGRPAVLVALATYGILIFPALGFFNVAFMRWSFVQDHFCYAASIPILALAAAALQGLFRRFEPLRNIIAGGLCVLASLLAFQHARHFATYEGLFLHALKAAPKSWLINYNLGALYHEQGRLEEAAQYYQTALESYPELATSHNNLGAILLGRGELAKGLWHMQRAASLEPDNQNYRGNYAQALAGSPDQKRAVEELKHMLGETPDWIMGQRLLAWVLATARDPAVRDGPKAVELAEKACSKTRLTLPRCLFTLSAARAEAGDLPRAVDTARHAAQLARQQGRERIAQRYEAAAGLYASGKAYRARPGETE